MNAEASASREITAVSGTGNRHENLVQECVTEDDEDNMQAESDESLEGLRMVNGEEGQLARK
ncbi:hypothetical protein MKX03_005086, partial [Papaver bracteatum]